MSVLDRISGPADVKALPADELATLAAEIREFLITSVAASGGHLGPNLGVVELTIALHRVFDSPADVLLWDTGHQAYVHKLLTGRAAGFSGLRQEGGLSGYPSRAESVHDVIENSHASTALSYADGFAKAFELRKQTERAVVAVVGDGALTGGMAWEALNNIAASSRPIVIVVNDNGRSYEPTVGGFAQHLATLRLLPQWESVLSAVKRTVPRAPLVGAPVYSALHGVKQGLKDLLQPQALFEDLGIKYVGPIDGHDVGAVEWALRRARRFHAPVVVHCMTKKGKGFEPAENDEADCMHGIGPIDLMTGRSRAAGGGVAWTDVFAAEMVALGHERSDIVGVSAAMVRPVGLHPFATEFPNRVFDVGIAEQHAVTSAAGLAMGGMHPVVCLYSTFLNRAFDQVLMDVGLHRQPMTLVLDRAGITGDDGPSHHGMWDLSVLGVVPGIRVAAPRDPQRLCELLREAVDDDRGPTALRFPKGRVTRDLASIGRVGTADVLRADLDADVLVVAAGALAAAALEAATLLSADGIRCTVVDPRWLLPVDPALLGLATECRLVVTVEDNVSTGGLGDAWARALRQQQRQPELLTLALPPRFIPHASRQSVLRRYGLDADGIAAAIRQSSGRTPARYSKQLVSD